jgi:predicted nuclease of predicted toxin-antitoxin system
MRLYLDENIPVVLASALKAHEIDCLTTQKAGNLGLSDTHQMDFGATQSRTLVTSNHRDFIPLIGELHRNNRSHTRLILSKELPVSELVRRLRKFINKHQDKELQNQIFWL